MKRKLSVTRKLVLAVEYIIFRLKNFNLAEDDEKWCDSPISYYAPSLFQFLKNC